MGITFPLCAGPPPIAELVGLFTPDPPFDKVYELGSNIERSGVWLAGRLGAALGGGGGAGALGGGVIGAAGAAVGGGGGGGAAGDKRPKALRAACSANDGTCPFIGGALGGGGAGAEGTRLSYR